VLTSRPRYNALDKSGEVDRLAALHDLAEVQAVTEDDIRAAIEELRRSTEAISKQTETLKQQQDALCRLVRKTTESDARRRDFEYSRQRRSDSERKHIAAEVSFLASLSSFTITDSRGG
jgi:predicted lipoprotein